MPGLQQQIDQHEQLSRDGNDGFLLTELVLMRPEPIMERRIAGTQGTVLCVLTKHPNKHHGARS